MNDAFEAGWIAAGEKKTSAGPLGFFESRTPVTPDKFATSTQFADPFWLRLLLRQTAGFHGLGAGGHGGQVDVPLLHDGHGFARDDDDVPVP
ncbi:hypothetical protein LX15_006413, partial [Streptoalloteichus tenebrarius]|nr:hypothetical protein [Streptoalloteichus tenebrarius]